MQIIELATNRGNLGTARTSDSLVALLDRAARIAASAAKAPVVVITVRRGRKLSIVGTFGLYVSKFDETWNIGSQLVRQQSMTYIPNVKRDPNFKDHPLLKAAPFARSIAHIPVPCRIGDIEGAISIINPEIKWPFSASMVSMLSDLAMLIGDSLAIVSEANELAKQSTATPGLSEGSPGFPLENSKDTAGQFLLATLASRTSIRNRADVSYITLRTWSKPIKEHQISALKIVKAAPDPAFVDSVAEEIAAHARRLFGVPRIGCVVPVPSGHTKHGECLSVKIARHLAEKLGVPFVDALAGEARPGKSHPAKNKNLKSPQVVTDATYESVLLVDDVASSGRHIELAAQSLRQITQHVTAIAWIGSA